MEDKLRLLKENLRKRSKLCIAYSGGTDSDFLLHIAKDVLGDQVIAVIANGVMLAPKDFQDAIRLVEAAKVSYYVVEPDALSVPEFVHNDKRRCYFCKKNIMGAVIAKAASVGYDIVADGKNADDGRVYRPGAQAAEELGIVSPLYEVGFTKSEIRACGKELGLETWQKASNSCLATRFPYDTLLTRESMARVAEAERRIAALSIPSGRVRVHGNIARIEMPKEYFSRFLAHPELVEEIKALGYRYVTLDLEGFRSGSMDE